MKELSIEEKAKAYDEALERAEKALEVLGTDKCEGARQILSLFPELCESENEKIRRALMKFIEKIPYERLENDGVSVKDALAWLEKQGEQKQYDIDVLEKHITKDSISELAHTVIVRNGWEIVDAKEQNPVWSEEDEVMIKVFDSIIRYIVEVVDKDALERFGTNREELFSWLKSLRPQPKQEWSEEDEKMFDYALDMIEWYSGKNGDKSRLVSDWLKSLKDRISLKQEWSKEDETELVNTIIMLKEGANIHFNKKDITKAVDWLKSLRPQPKQKWTEEDQNALEDVREAVVHYWGGDSQDILLYWLKSLKQRIKGE